MSVEKAAKIRSQSERYREEWVVWRRSAVAGFRGRWRRWRLSRIEKWLRKHIVELTCFLGHPEGSIRSQAHSLISDLLWYQAIGSKEILAGAVAPSISNLSHESGAVRQGALHTITGLIEAGISPDSFERAVLPTAADLRNPSRALRSSAQITARILAAKRIAPLLLTEAIMPSVDNLIVPHWYDIGELRLLVSYAGWTLKTMLEMEVGYEVFGECIPTLAGFLTSDVGGYTSTCLLYTSVATGAHAEVPQPRDHSPTPN